MQYALHGAFFINLAKKHHNDYSNYNKWHVLQVDNYDFWVTKYYPSM